MASKLLRNRMKPMDHQKRSDHDVDVLALEKAAAWAWYQHGSEGKTVREFHITRTQRDLRPSRYKLEAMRTASSSSSSSSSEDTNKSLPLLDAYEVRSILTRLDSFIADSRGDKLDNGFGFARANGGKKTTMKKKKVGKGIGGERRRVRAICSAGIEDVVDGIRTRGSKLSKPKGSMPVVNNNGGRLM